jgi:drug/metabolite transporter (DMT)-like permease
VRQVEARDVMAALLALVGAVLIGTGSAKQHAVVVAEDPHAPMDPRLIVHLARRKAWLLGNLMAFGGFVCIAAAIATGRLLVVEPIGSTQVLFALLYAAYATRRGLRRREWAAIAITITGLAGFLLVASPQEAAEDASPVVPWAVPLGVLAVAVVVGVVVARTLTPDRRGIIFAALAGLGFGTADALIKAISTVPGDFGDGHILRHWSLYAWIVVSPLAFLLQQSAYHSTHLGAALPATATLGPTTATLLGAAMFGERLRGGWFVPVELAFFAVLLVGVARLAMSDTLEAPVEVDAEATTPEIAASTE